MTSRTLETILVAALFCLLSTTPTQAQSVRSATGDVPMIFDVRKSLPMEPTELSFHDFYINAGSEAGFKKGQYLPVQRAMPVHDPVQNKQQGILTVPVGKILVIHVERNITVARLAAELGDEERPTLEYEAIMIGDTIDMNGVSTEPPKNPLKKKKRASAAIEEVNSLAPKPEIPAPSSQPPVNSDSASQLPPAVLPQRVTQPVPPPTA